MADQTDNPQPTILSSITKEKRRLSELGELLHEIADSESYSPLSEEEREALRVSSRRIQELLKKSDVELKEVQFSVVGRFSSGKSTLLNAMLKAKVLSHAQNRTTASVTVIRYEPELYTAKIYGLKQADFEQAKVIVETALKDANFDPAVAYERSTRNEDDAYSLRGNNFLGAHGCLGADGHPEMSAQPGALSPFAKLCEYRKREGKFPDLGKESTQLLQGPDEKRYSPVLIQASNAAELEDALRHYLAFSGAFSNSAQESERSQTHLHYLVRAFA